MTHGEYMRRTHPWPEEHPFPSLVPKPTANPETANPKLDTKGRVEDWATISLSILRL